MADWKIPFGRAKGETLIETDPANIRWVIDALQTKLDENPEKPFADKDRQWIAAAKAELKRRENGGAQRARQPAAAPVSIQRTPPAALGASMNDPAAVTAHLTRIYDSHHVVSPTTTIDCLPPGCGVAVNYVLVNPSTDASGPGEVYKLADKVGLSGTTISKIAAAAGVGWDPSQSGRLDNGSDPHYVHFRAVGHVRNFDGSVRPITGEVEIDARDGSPQIDEIKQKSAKKGKDPASQILELRKFLLRHAESKAKNRAVANGLGLKRSYNPDELKKPFAVCRLMFTGQSDNPEERKMFAEKTADAMIGSMTGMYGKPMPQPAPAPHAQPAQPRFDTHNAPQFAGHAPPPVGPAPVEIEDFDDYDFGGDTQDGGDAPQQQAQSQSTPQGGSERVAAAGNAPAKSPAGATAAGEPAKAKAAKTAPAQVKTEADQADEDRSNGIDPNY